MKKIIITLCTLLSISAFAECRILQIVDVAGRLTIHGKVTNMTTKNHLLKDDKLLWTASVTVKIKHGANKATQGVISKALGKWIEEKAKLREVSTVAGCGQEILDEIDRSTFSVGY
jgi:predicted Mrr-cat superfamily restriction endonuclease